ncbi:MAG: cysteine dioxygenase family protein [Candidatus Eremiobacteraeota bacterium]|nr:cysteine dioxygenase family protein [Candidatus Eremiobacteraeota bacterium]
MAPALVAPIARAIKDDRVTALAAALGALRTSGALDDPALFPEPNFGRYARKLVWADPGLRFVIVGMTWAPGQGTPLHDHGGLWGGEIVIHGVMAETTYELTERIDDRWRFVRGEEHLVAAGSVGLLSPPNEYHALRNAGDTTAHTLHIYSADLTRSRAFDELGDGSYHARSVELSYDA